MTESESVALPFGDSAKIQCENYYIIRTENCKCFLIFCKILSLGCFQPTSCHGFVQFACRYFDSNSGYVMHKGVNVYEIKTKKWVDKAVFIEILREQWYYT